MLWDYLNEIKLNVTYVDNKLIAMSKLIIANKITSKIE
jgi:hypothetical protein